MDKPQILLHHQKAVNYTVYDCKWVPSSAKFIVLGGQPKGTGQLEIYEIDKGDVTLVDSMERGKTFKCGTFGATSLEQRYLATGAFDGRLQMWDLDRKDFPVFSVKAHNEIINAIDGVGGLGIGEGAPELVTASRDGSVKVWDPRQKGEPVATMEPESSDAPTIDNTGGPRDCWAVAFGHAYTVHDRCVAAGYDNGDIKLFDLRAMAIRWEHNVGNGICSLQFDRPDIAMNKLVATTLEAKFHVFDMRTQHPEKGFACLTEKAHKSTVWLVKHLPQNRDVFLTAGGAGSVTLWKYNYPSRRAQKVTTLDNKEVMEGVAGTLSHIQNIGVSTQPLSGFDWNPDKLGLGVCTAFDQAIRLVICTRLNTI